MSAAASAWLAKTWRPALLLALTGLVGSGFAACDDHAALVDPLGTAGAGGGSAGATAGTGVAGTGAGVAGTGAGVAGTGVAVTGVAGAGAFDAGAADAPVINDAGSGACAPTVTTPPSGTFSFLSAGNAGTCGLRPDGKLVCWGEYYYPVPDLTGTFKDVSRLGAICAIRASGQLACWGGEPDTSPPPAGTFEQVVTGENGNCARSADGSVSCWGSRFATYFAPDAYKFETLTGGAYSMCGLEAGLHRVICWSPRDAGSVTVLPGTFTEVDTGRFFACGLRTDGTAVCWDTQVLGMAGGQANHPAAAGVFHGLSVGEVHACALKADGQVTCWGDAHYGDHYQDLSPPAGTILKSVAPGSEHTCGVLPDDTVRCWGKEPFCTG